MASSLPWFQFWRARWLNDPELSLCSMEAQGFFLRAILIMHQVESGTLSGSVKQLARICSCLDEECERALLDLQRHHAADVTKKGDVWTITCRSVAREFKLKHDNRERQRAHRARSRHGGGNAKRNAPKSSGGKGKGKSNAKSNAENASAVTAERREESRSDQSTSAVTPLDEMVNGDKLGQEITVFIRDHKRLPHEYPKLKAEIRACVEKFGWDKTREAIDLAISNHAHHPGSYALQVLTGDADRASLRSRSRVQATAAEPLKENKIHDI